MSLEADDMQYLDRKFNDLNLRIDKRIGEVHIRIDDMHKECRKHHNGHDLGKMDDKIEELEKFRDQTFAVTANNERYKAFRVDMWGVMVGALGVAVAIIAIIWR